ncbi:MAG: potassium transporter Kup [Microthrixaceae bacterium]
MSTSADGAGGPVGLGPKARLGAAALTLGALGVVFGDIGTSPLYAFRETFEGHGIPVTGANVIGACSLILWSLILVVSIKYIVFILRADNQGEGGILALTELVVGRGAVKGRMWVLLVIGLFGMALLYGDGVITPAISVLSAVEGLEVVSPSFRNWVIPLSVGILIGLFAMQRRGTGAVGALFGPVMLVWFGTLAVLGVSRITGELSVLDAINPVHAVQYLVRTGFKGFLSLGSVFLVVTGGEALYADLGHFGRRPIRQGWFMVAFPALVLNYFGQGALLVEDPEAISSPLFTMGPDWSRWPMVLLATCATVIASQALISGAFSLTVQAAQLDYLPRITVRHTSASHFGQVYLPAVNWLLALGCVGLVVAFGSSAKLAAAYGVAVTATMGITTLLFYVLVRQRWGWSTARALAVCIPFAVLDLGFFGANVFKIPYGGWFPIVVAIVIIVMMTTWRTGRRAVGERLAAGSTDMADFLDHLPPDLIRVPGTAAFLYSRPLVAPPALRTNTAHNHTMHRTVLLVAVQVASAAYVAGPSVSLEDLGSGVYQVVLRHGYMEKPDVVSAIGDLQVDGRTIDASDTTFFIGRETVIPTPQHTMATWRERLFAVQLRSAAPASRFFGLPSAQVVEVGSQVEI